MMLRGHESLIRMVGKRRRLNPTLVSPSVDPFLSEGQEQRKVETPSSERISFSKAYGQEGEVTVSPKIRNSATNKESFRDSEMANQNCNPVGKESSNMEWVQCPVCGKNIQGKNSSINSHLDFCLLEESKCKNTQLTISHFNPVFIDVGSKMRKETRSKIGKLHPSCPTLQKKPSTDGLSFLSDENIMAGPFQSSMVLARESVSRRGNNCILGSEEDGEAFVESVASGVQSLFPDKRDSVVAKEELKEANLSEDVVCGCFCHTSRKSIEIISMEERGTNSTEENKDICEGGSVVKDIHGSFLELDTEQQDVVVNAIETRVVGRKFNQGASIEKGMKIRLVREPENPKDPNAIKVVPLDTQSGLVLGHLPRDLALHLSPLLDKGLLQVQGFVTDVQNKAFEPVPVKLLCERSSNGIAEVQLFEKSWQNVMYAVEKSGREGAFHLTGRESPYQQNFLYVLKTVLDRDAHLFNEEEKAFLGSFFSLSEDAQCLFIRLYQRKGPWFRIAHVIYQEVSSVDLALNELLVAGYLTTGDNLDRELCLERGIRERLEVLNVPELKQLISTIQCKKKIESGIPKREDLLNWIVTAVSEKYRNSTFESTSRPAMVSLLMEAIGVCVCISELASLLFWRVQRLFFLNGEQDLSSFLLVHMGRIRYPNYVCRRTRHVFATRKSFLAYEQALEVAQAMDMALETNDRQSVLQFLEKACIQLGKEGELECVNSLDPGNIFLARFSAAWVYTTVVTLGVSVLERERRYVEAVELLKQLLSQKFCPGRRGYWTMRLSMDCEHLGNKEESLKVAEAGLHDARIRNGDRIALQRRVLRLGKPPRRWKKPPFAEAVSRTCKEICIRGRPLKCVTGLKSRFYGYDGQQCTVEELALQFFAGEDGGHWQGVHSEGGVWMTLFGLLMWDVLFADVPNVFMTPFQTAPLDLNTDAFYPARESAIEAQLKRICDGEAAELLAATWVKCVGIFCNGVNWERHSLEELQVISSCIGGPGLAAVCRLLAEDHCGWKGGMPDLLLWRLACDPQNSSSICSACSCSEAEVPVFNGQNQHMQSQFVKGEAKLVEVKGPRDRLSEQQRAWILMLMDAGLCVEVCKVLEQPPNGVL